MINAFIFPHHLLFLHIIIYEVHYYKHSYLFPNVLCNLERKVLIVHFRYEKYSFVDSVVNLCIDFTHCISVPYLTKCWFLVVKETYALPTFYNAKNSCNSTKLLPQKYGQCCCLVL